MKKKKMKNDLMWDAILLIAFVVYTWIIASFDVRLINGAASEVGLSRVNEFFFNKLPYNDVFYNISKVFGYASFILIAYFGLVGLKQLIERKNVLKVDNNILIFGGTCVVMLAIYAVFEFAIINYRPIILDPEEWPESSYPSSHTFLAMTLCGTGLYMIHDYIKNESIRKIISVILTLGSVVIVVSRLLSGVHWFTDIVGSVILSSLVIKLFITAVHMWGNDKTVG